MKRRTLLTIVLFTLALLLLLTVYNKEKFVQTTPEQKSQSSGIQVTPDEEEDGIEQALSELEEIGQALSELE